MTIEQTVEIPFDRRLVMELPPDTPPGMAKVAITISPAELPAKLPVEELPHDEAEILRQIEELKRTELPRPRTIAEAIKQAEAIAADPNRLPISRLFGILKDKPLRESGVEYQRRIRDEWD
jgi:hypothetical protein